MIRWSSALSSYAIAFLCCLLFSLRLNPHSSSDTHKTALLSLFCLTAPPPPFHHLTLCLSFHFFASLRGGHYDDDDSGGGGVQYSTLSSSFPALKNKCVFFSCTHIDRWVKFRSSAVRNTPSISSISSSAQVENTSKLLSNDQHLNTLNYGITPIITTHFWNKARLRSVEAFPPYSTDILCVFCEEDALPHAHPPLLQSCYCEPCQILIVAGKWIIGAGRLSVPMEMGRVWLSWQWEGCERCGCWEELESLVGDAQDGGRKWILRSSERKKGWWGNGKRNAGCRTKVSLLAYVVLSTHLKIVIKFHYHDRGYTFTAFLFLIYLNTKKINTNMWHD